jgi:hypothetical protein
MHTFTRERLERTVIAGRLFVEPVRDFMGVRWSYDVRFSAPIPRPPSASELAADLSSPPARAAEAHLAASRAGSLAPFLDTMSDVAAREYRGADGAERLAQLRVDLPADSRVVRLVPQTDGTVLANVEGHDRGILIGYTFRMILDASRWKVTK